MNGLFFARSGGNSRMTGTTRTGLRRTIGRAPGQQQPRDTDGHKLGYANR